MQVDLVVQWAKRQVANMADFFKGLAGGFGTGLQLGQAVRERNMRDELAQAYAKPETSQGYTAETGQQLEELAKTGAYDIVPQYGPAAEGQAQGVFTGYSAVPKAGLDLQGDMPAAPMAFNPQQVQDYGGRRVAGQFNPTELRGLQMQEAARVLGSYGDVRGAAALQAQAEEQAYQAQKRPLELAGLKRQAELGDIQLTDAQRKQRMQVDFDNGFAKINEQKFEKPEDRTAAILSLVEKTQGVTAAEQLRSSYSQNELNQISIQSKKFDEGFRQSRAKGVIPALEWFDEQNTSFKLERDPKNPFRYIQVNQDGTRSVFADAKNERELGMIIDAKAKPGGFLELAKYDLDVQKTNAAVERDKAAAARDRRENISPLEKNLATLKRLNIPVTDAQIKTLVLGVQKDPALEAELAAITKIAGSDTANPEVLKALPGQIQAALARSKGRETAAAVVAGLTQAQEAGKGAEAIAELRKRNMPEPAIQAAAMQAGVAYTAPATAPAAAPAAAPASAAPASAAPAGVGLARSVQAAVSGDSPAQLDTIRIKIANRIPLSGVEQIIAQRNNITAAR